MAPESLRIPDVDPTWAQELVAFLERQIAHALQRLDGEPDAFNQIDCVFLAGYWLDLAGLWHALGKPEPDVRGALREAGKSYRLAFRLKHTQMHVPMLGPEGEEARHPTTDDSLTNSRTGLKAMLLALIGEGLDAAREMALMVEDPEGASYLGSVSAICTYDEQALAYALKHLLLGHPPEAELELRKMGATEPPLVRQIALLRALAQRDPNALRSALEANLRHYGLTWQSGEALRRPESYLDLASLGCAALALALGILREEGLPEGGLHAPWPLLAEDRA